MNGPENQKIKTPLRVVGVLGGNILKVREISKSIHFLTPGGELGRQGRRG